MRVTHRLAWLCAVALVGAAHAQSSAAPEVAKTVDAFHGQWALTGTDAEPGASAVRLTITIDCDVVALGAAVNCLIAGELPGVGPIAAAAVVGYSPDKGLVRWMEISSTGEYHDHKGKWREHEIEFEPLAYIVGGQKATEYLHIDFPSAGRLVLHAVTETAGGTSTLDCTGTRT